MTTNRTGASVTRRTALAGLGAGGLGLALAATVHHASAQDATAEAMANHLIVGVWNSMTPGGPSLAIFHADGSASFADTVSSVDPAHGVVGRSPGFGAWEPTGPRSIHFTSTELMSDANGAFVGFGTVDGYPEVSEDGQSLHDDQSQVKITIRDASGVVIQEIAAAGAPPVVGYRVSAGSPGFPPTTPGTATPTT